MPTGSGTPTSEPTEAVCQDLRGGGVLGRRRDHVVVAVEPGHGLGVLVLRVDGLELESAAALDRLNRTTLHAVGGERAAGVGGGAPEGG